jgi:hypothetical protein
VSSFPSDLPDRPDAPAGAGRPGRRWLPTGLVALVMGVTVLGGFVVAEALPEPEIRPVTLGDILKVHPLVGWEVIHRERVIVPSPTGGALSGEFAQLTRGSGALDLLALPGVGMGCPTGCSGSSPGTVSKVSGSATSGRSRGAVLPSRGPSPSS